LTSKPGNHHDKRIRPLHISPFRIKEQCEISAQRYRAKGMNWFITTSEDNFQYNQAIKNVRRKADKPIGVDV